MTSVLSSVSYWLGGTRDVSPERIPVTVTADGQILEQAPVPTEAPRESHAPSEPGQDEESGRGQNERSSLEMDLQEVSEKAMQAAREWGSYLYSFGKTATEQVVKTARQLKESVEDKTLLGEFGREQDLFVADHQGRRAKEGGEGGPVPLPPWVGCEEEDIMKAQILDLSKEKRNFLRAPPAGVQFEFDYDSCHPLAQTMLGADPALKAMRFNLVPKQIQEEVFWRNYFYRVSLIRQSTRLTSLAGTQPCGEGLEWDDLAEGGSAEGGFTQRGGEARRSEVAGRLGGETNAPPHSNKDPDLDDDSIDDLPDWERELQAELQEYEVIECVPNDAAADDLDEDIMRDIAAASPSPGCGAEPGTPS